MNQDRQRAGFEAWADENGIKTTKWDDGSYLYTSAVIGWLAYQAALASPEVQALRWQPIDTAPKDGSHVLLRSRSGRMADGFWGVRYEVWSWPYVMTEPAYWMPLPPPPADAAMEKKP